MKQLKVIKEAGKRSREEAILREAMKKGEEAKFKWEGYKPYYANVSPYWEGMGSREEALPRIEKAGKSPYNPLIDFISQEGSRRITKNIVRKIAYDTKERYCGEACRQLEKSHFQEAIFDDVVAYVEEELFFGMQNNLIWFDFNDSVEGLRLIIKYGTYSNEAGEEKFFYNKLCNAVERAFYSFNGRQAPRKEKGIIQNYDGIYYNEEAGKAYPTYKADLEGEKKEGEKKEAGSKEINNGRSKASPLYIASLAEEGSEEIIEEALLRYDFSRLMQYIKKKASTRKYSNYCKVIEGLFQGLKNEEIARKYNISMGIVKHSREDLKTYFKLWKQEKGEEISGYYYKNGIKVRRKASSVNFITTCQEDNTFSGKQLGEGYTEEGSREARKKKEEGFFHVVGLPNYEKMKQEAGEAMKKHTSYNYKSLEHKKKQEEGFFRDMWKDSKKVNKSWKEAGKKAEENYIISKAWEEATKENIRRQEAWEDYTRFLAFNSLEEAKDGAKEYKKEGSFLVVYEAGEAVRKYPIHEKVNK